jgi:hypothetical protein
MNQPETFKIRKSTGALPVGSSSNPKPEVVAFGRIGNTELHGPRQTPRNGMGRGSRTRPAVKKSTQKGTADRRDDQPRRRDDFALETVQPVAKGTAGQAAPTRSGNDRVAPLVPPYTKPVPVGFQSEDESASIPPSHSRRGCGPPWSWTDLGCQSFFSKVAGKKCCQILMKCVRIKSEP